MKCHAQSLSMVAIAWLGFLPTTDVFGESIPSEMPKWWQSKLGMEELVLPGYQPVHVKDQTLQLYARQYTWGTSYLPVLITSRGQKLTGPMTLVLKSNGLDLDLTPTTVQIKENGGHHVSVVSKGITLKGLEVEVTTRVEYDGLAMVTVQLRPQVPISVEGLAYEVDIARSQWTETLGFTAEGIRPQKNRHDVLQLPYRGDFVNVLDFADGERSFWWFADNAKGWILNDKETTTEVIDFPHFIKLRQRLISGPFTINKPMIFAFNFLATPVRDLGEDWRSERIVAAHPSAYEASLGGKYKTWWTDAFAHDAYPYTVHPPNIAKQVSLYDLTVYPGLEHQRNRIKETITRYGIHWIPYFSAHCLITLDPAIQNYRKLWEVLPPAVLRDGLAPYQTVYDKPLLTHRAESYSNYLLWRLDQEIDQLGMAGIYLDHGMVFDSYNPENGGWIDSKGRKRSSLDILALRKFLKRLKTLFYLKGKGGYIFVHDSNREIIPAYSFVTGTVDGEQYRRTHGGPPILQDGDYLKILDLNEMRTRFSSHQYGVISIFLAGEWNSHVGDQGWQTSELNKRAFRRLMAVTLLHDTLYWDPYAHPKERERLVKFLDSFQFSKSQFVGYWNLRGSIQTNHEDVRISYYQRNHDKALMLVATNISDNPLNAMITLDKEKLGLSSARKLVRVTGFDNEGFLFDDKTIALSIKGKDFALIRIE